jgi:hypothetical protein
MSDITMKIIAGVNKPADKIEYAVKGYVSWPNSLSVLGQFNTIAGKLFIKGMNPIDTNVGDSVLETQTVYTDHCLFVTLYNITEPDPYGRKIAINGIVYYQAKQYICTEDPPPTLPPGPTWEAKDVSFSAIQMNIDILEQKNGEWITTNKIKNLTATRKSNCFCKILRFLKK